MMPKTEIKLHDVVARLQNQIGELVGQLVIKDMQLEVTVAERDGALAQLEQLRGKNNAASQEPHDLGGLAEEAQSTLQVRPGLQAVPSSASNTAEDS